MKRAERVMVERHLDLLFEFERYVAEHPSSAARIPRDAVVVLQVRGDETYNRWSQRLAEKQARKTASPIVEVWIDKLGPIRSRIRTVKIGQAA